MPFVGKAVTPPPREQTEKRYKVLTDTKLFFLSQNAWTAPYAKTYVTKLLKEAPQAKEVVEGKLAVVTGVTIGGAGYYMAEELALGAGMHVVMMGRNEEKLKAAMAAIEADAKKRKVPKPTLYETKYDLDDLTTAISAAEFTTKLAKDKYDGKLHVLLNNAGANSPKQTCTKQDIEVNVGRNYITPHLLTKKLIPVLEKAATPTYKPRCHFVASMGHIIGSDFIPSILLEDPKSGGAPPSFFKEDGTYKEANIVAGAIQYGRAKLGLVADAVALTKKHPGINFTSCQPGSIASNFGASLGAVAMIYYYGFYFFQYTPSQGACTSLRAVLDPDFNTAPDLQGAYLNADANPWLPKDPVDSEGNVIPIDKFAPEIYETADKLIEKVMK